MSYSRELVVGVMDQFTHLLLAPLDDVDFLCQIQGRIEKSNLRLTARRTMLSRQVQYAHCARQ